MATTIAITDLTNATKVAGSVSNGTGVFDELMNTVNLYLADQYTSGRIKGTDYANVLLGSIQAVLQQSVQFTMQKRQTEAQVDAILQQTLTEVQNTAKLTYEIANILPAQKAMLDQQKLTEVQSTAKVSNEKDLIYVERVIKDKTCAALGLDDVVKTAEASRSAQAEFVYTPAYNKGI